MSAKTTGACEDSIRIAFPPALDAGPERHSLLTPRRLMAAMVFFMLARSGKV